MYPNNLKYSKEHEWVDLESKKKGKIVLKEFE